MTNPTTNRPWHPVLLALAAWLVAAAAAHAAERERWYVLMLQGQRAGHMRAFERTDADAIATGTVMDLRIKRGTANVRLKFESRSEEAPDGTPRRLETVAELGFQPIRKTYVFTADGIELTSDQGGSKTTQKLPRPEGDWMMPAAAERAVLAALARNEQTITTRTLEDTFTGGLATVTTTRKLLERGSVEALGRTVPGLKWSVSIDLMPSARSEEWTDESGELVRGTLDLGGIQLEQILADRDLALADVNPPELLVSTLVKPSRPIDRPRTVREGVYRVSVSDGALDDLPDAAGQRAERLDPRTIRVRVLADGPVDRPNAQATDADRAASAMINGDDPVIADLARRALREAKINDTDPPAARAEALRRFAHAYIDAKGLDVGFASASEVARTRTGDCTEHAVLLAALLRSRGIPARVVSGLIYGEEFVGQRGIFGYHLWTRAWLPDAEGRGRWVDLDATLDDRTPFDATHIALSESTLGDGERGNAMIGLAPLLGRLRIEVESTR